MNLEKLTTQSAASIQASLQLAGQKHQSQVSPWHLLSALISQPGGIVPSLLTHLKFDIEKTKTEIEEKISSLPSSSGPSQVSLSSDFAKVLESAESEAGKLRDEFVSTEHLLWPIRFYPLQLDRGTRMNQWVYLLL